MLVAPDKIRLLSVAALLMVGCRDPVAEQLERLSDSDFAQRLAAFEALRRVDDERIPPALAALVADPDPIIRVRAINALASCGESAAHHLPAVLGALEDPDPSVRLPAALAAAAIDPTNREFVPVLRQAMLDGDGPVFLAVGRLGPNGAWATPTLVGLLSHPEARIRVVAALTLGEIGPDAGDAIDGLRRALDDPEPAVRKRAHEALDRIADPAAR